MRNKQIILSLVFTVYNLCGIAQNTQYSKEGLASFYADKFEGRETANGEIYYHAKKTAAHRTLPFGTIVKVTNLENEKTAVVRINDRGPFIDNRIIDLSKSVAHELGFVKKGLAKVKIEVIANTNDIPDNKPKTDNEKPQKAAYYLLDSKKVSPNGRGIQIGSFSNDDNLIRLIADLKNTYHEKVYIEIAKVSDKTFYRLIIGNSSSQTELSKLRSKLIKDFPDCFIVEFK